MGHLQKNEKKKTKRKNINQHNGVVVEHCPIRAFEPPGHIRRFWLLAFIVLCCHLHFLDVCVHSYILYIPVVMLKTILKNSCILSYQSDLSSSRAKNKALGLAGQADILIGHLHNFDTIMVKFWMAIVENCMENGQWPVTAILSSVQYAEVLNQMCALRSKS